ncbi:zinc finger protein 124-like [Perognathus longimembris pacificus]|uniref:zinc finger protein 124-like n=1 Tax=Perognathus longimembris pacificus TaxID=214514 RepID=UPI002019F3C4|nr:zinc finger protein 124-like [Perognathus longimembris pacificus]
MEVTVKGIYLPYMVEPFSFKDVSVKFSKEEWALLDHSQKSFYRDVMLETFSNFSCIGTKWTDLNRNDQHKNSQKNLRILLPCGVVPAYPSFVAC